jgi:L-amino acid N-acyltransferase YncA
MNNLVIRPSAAADIAAITEIYADAVINGTASFELEPPTERDMAARRSALVEGGFPYLVAERAGALVGYAYAGPYRSRPAYRFTVEDSVYVARSAQGRGIGRALLSAVVDAAEARGFRLMIAVIGDKASAGSIRLHESLGFAPVGVLEPVGYKHGRWLATVLMQRVLGEGAATPPVALNSRPA